MHIDTIEYQTRAALIAALLDLRKTSGVVAIDIVGNGRALRVTHAGDALLKASEAPQTAAASAVVPPVPPAAPDAPQTPSEPVEVVPPPVEEVEDLIGAPKVPRPGPKKSRR